MANDIDIFSLQPSVLDKSLRGKYILLYGKPKCGKTSFAVQAPRALVCAFELGVNALAGTRYVPILRWSDFKKVMAQLKKPQAKEMYDTVVLDTVSIAYELCEKFILQRESVSSIKDIPFGAGYGMVSGEFQECLREITMLGFGLILICHSKEVATNNYDEDGNPIMMIQPSLSKRPMEICNAICDVIGAINTEFENGKAVRYLYTRQTPTIFAGSRYKYLKEKLPFGYNELTEAISEAIEKSVELDGAQVVEKGEQIQIKDRPFQEVMNEAKELWTGYLDNVSNEEEREVHYRQMRDIIKRVFGHEDFKLSQAVMSQVDLVEIFIAEMKNLVENS